VLIEDDCETTIRKIDRLNILPKKDADQSFIV
jgi:hypothetical protein